MQKPSASLEKEFFLQNGGNNCTVKVSIPDQKVLQQWFDRDLKAKNTKGSANEPRLCGWIFNPTMRGVGTGVKGRPDGAWLDYKKAMRVRTKSAEDTGMESLSNAKEVKYAQVRALETLKTLLRPFSVILSFNVPLSLSIISKH